MIMPLRKGFALPGHGWVWSRGESEWTFQGAYQCFECSEPFTVSFGAGQPPSKIVRCPRSGCGKAQIAKADLPSAQFVVEEGGM